MTEVPWSSQDGPAGRLDTASFFLLILLVCAVPLAFTPRFETYPTAKILLVQLLVPASAAACIWALILHRGNLRTSFLTLPFALFLGACALSAVTATYRPATLGAIAGWGCAWMVMELASRHSQVRGRDWILISAITLSAGCAAAIGLLQYTDVVDLYTQFHHPISTLGNVTLVAALYNLAFPMALAAAFISRHPLRRGTMGLVAVMIVGHTVVMGSRAGWLGMFIGGSLVLGTCVRANPIRLSRRMVLRAGSVLVVAAAAIALTSETWVSQRVRLHSKMMLHQLTEAAQLRDPSSRQRVFLWRDTLRMGVARLPLGVGAGNYEYDIPAYASEEAQQIEAQMEKLTRRPRTPMEAHNEYLEVFAETGLPGLLTFGWLVLVLLRLAVRELRVAWQSRQVGLGVGAASGVLTAMLHACFSTTLQNPASGIVFWLAAGMLAASADAKRKALVPTWTWGAAAAAVLVLSMVQAVEGVRGAAGHRAGRKALTENRGVEAAALLEQALGHRPQRRYSTYQALGQANLKLGRWYAAAHAFGRAADEHPIWHRSITVWA